MTEKFKPLIVSCVISIILLLFFSIMQLCDSKILQLEIKWLIVSGIPILIGLLLSGVIKNFKGFGVELETNLSEKVELELVGSVESYPTPELTKQSMLFLHDMSPREKSKIERLQFEYGKQDYYNTLVVGEYLTNLSRLRYIEIIDSDGKFLGLLPAGIFKEKRGNIDLPLNPTKIELLIRSIETRTIHENFKDFITDCIKKDDTLLQAFRKFTLSDQGKRIYGDQILPVLDSNDRMIGLTIRSKLADKIAKQVIKSEK